MKTLTVRQIDPNVEEKVIRMLNTGAPFEQVVHSMRLAGLNKIESMKLLRNHAHISLTEAKSVVHLSPSWHDHLESDSLLHEQAIQAAEELGFTGELH